MLFGNPHLIKPIPVKPIAQVRTHTAAFSRTAGGWGPGVVVVVVVWSGRVLRAELSQYVLFTLFRIGYFESKHHHYPDGTVHHDVYSYNVSMSIQSQSIKDSGYKLLFHFCAHLSKTTDCCHLRLGFVNSIIRF